MTVRRARRPALALVLVLVALAMAAGGCTAARRMTRPRVVVATKVLVLPRLAVVENRPITDRAVDLLAATLRGSRPVLTTGEFLQAAAMHGSSAWAVRFVERMQLGGRPTPDDALELTQHFVVGDVRVLEVTTYDQVWGKYAKFTRVGVDVHAFDLTTGTVLHAHRDVEVEDKRGRAFEYATESAVAEVARAFDGPSFDAMEAWRFWRR